MPDLIKTLRDMIFLYFSFKRLTVVTKTKLSKLYYRNIYIHCIALAETFVKGRDLLQYNYKWTNHVNFMNTHQLPDLCLTADEESVLKKKLHTL